LLTLSTIMQDLMMIRSWKYMSYSNTKTSYKLVYKYPA
jgi:hypothetical protein